MWYSIDRTFYRRDRPMKNKQFRLHSQLYQLRQMKNKGKQEVIWKLSQEQKEFLERFFEIEPFSYVIRTKQFERIRNIDSTLLKDIHYACKQGKRMMTRQLSKDQKTLLQDYNVSFTVCKYRIVLRGK